MAIRYYDDSIVNKVKNWVIDNNMHILSPDQTSRLLQIRADELNDEQLKLPLIAISRDPEIEIVSTAQKPLTYDGNHLEANCKTSKLLNAIPIKLSYQLDIYTRYFAEADEYARNFLFNFINYPKLSIEIPYNDSKIKHESTILVEQKLSDNSDIPERLIPGQFTRMTLNLTIDDAYLFSVPFMPNWKIEPGDIKI